MNKHHLIHSNYILFVSLLILAVLSNGCGWLFEEETYYSPVATEKLRQIETLELKEAQDQETETVEVNEPAPAELELTLEQCRALTLENNLDLKVQLINPAIALENITQQEAQFEAAFTTSATYSKTDTPTSSTLSGSQGQSANVNMGVQVPLRTGGTINFDLADTRSKTDNIFSTLNPSYTADSTISLSQPLLRNAGTRVNTYSIQIAKSNSDITSAATKLEVIRVLANVERVYWRLYAARRELEVRQQQYDLAVALLEQARRFVDAGEQAQIEVIRSESGAAQQLEAIITAENNVRDRERELKQTLNKANLQMNTPTVLIPATEPDPVRYEIDKEQLVEIALDQRIEMLELELQIAQDALAIDYQQNQTLPLVTLDYSYNINGLGRSREGAYDLLADKRFEDHRFGLQLSVPIGNESAKSQLRQAIYQRSQRLASRENRAAAIEYEVLNAIDQLEANWLRILASRQSALLDGRLYEAERRQYELGLVTSTDVLQAQTNFANSQSSEIAALVEYQIAIVDLAFATGTLLGEAKVRWEPIIPTENVP